MCLATCRTEPHIVYWMYLPCFVDPFSEGYIGVTKQKLDARVALHISQTSSPALRRAFAEYGETILWRPLHTDLPIRLAYLIERAYRPARYIGWNAGRGGRSFKCCREDWYVTNRSIYQRRY